MLDEGLLIITGRHSIGQGLTSDSRSWITEFFPALETISLKRFRRLIVLFMEDEQIAGKAVSRISCMFCLACFHLRRAKWLNENRLVFWMKREGRCP